MVPRRKGLLFLLLGTLVFFLAFQLTFDSSHVRQAALVSRPPTTKHLRATSTSNASVQQRITPSSRQLLPQPPAVVLQPARPAPIATSVSVLRRVVPASSTAPRRPLAVRRPFAQDRGLKEAIRQQLHKQRVRLSYHNMVQLFRRALRHYPTVPKDKVQRIIIVTYFRSGSTFVGDILQANPRTFYHFEPLHMYSNDARLNSTAARKGVDLMGHLLRCQFNRTGDYMRWVTKSRNQFLFRRNRFLWSHCGLRHPVCFKADFVTGACERAPYHIAKLTRLSVAQVKDLVLDTDLGATKLVHLVRDPRGILASRRLLDWCQSSNCSDDKTLCREMREDLDAFDLLRRDFPSRTIRVRYEDVSVNPEGETKALFKNLGLPYSSSVVMFLETHTKARRQEALDPYSTKRNSSTVPFEWRRKLKFQDIQRIQEACRDVLQRLGYKSINKLEDVLGDLPMGPMPEATGTNSEGDPPRSR